MTDNIVKKVCKELGITQKELAERLEVQPSAVSNWSKGDIPQMTQLALELLIENKDLKETEKSPCMPINVLNYLTTQGYQIIKYKNKSDGIGQRIKLTLFKGH